MIKLTLRNRVHRKKLFFMFKIKKIITEKILRNKPIALNTPLNYTYLNNFKIEEGAKSFSFLIKSFHKKVEMITSIKSTVLSTGSVLAVGVIAVKTIDIIDYETFKALLQQTDPQASIQIVRESIEYKAAEYIKSFKLSAVRIILPNNVSPTDLQGENVENLSTFLPVLNGLYVDLINDYDLSGLISGNEPPSDPLTNTNTNTTTINNTLNRSISLPLWILSVVLVVVTVIVHGNVLIPEIV